MQIEKELNFFFEQYRIFLSFESVTSLLRGREYRIIQFFYILFIAISEENPNKKRIDRVKGLLFGLLEDFQKKSSGNAIEIIKPYTNSFSAVANPQLSQNFLFMVEASQQYLEWRKKLPKQAKLAIYLKNLQDRQKYYFKESLNDLNNTLMQQDITKSYMLRQTLIEFYNALSHLYVAYCGNGARDENIKRASSHFQRGALDSYKSIIKDFCVLADGQNVPISIINRLKKLRGLECATIGNDLKRKNENTLPLYKEITTNIIGFIK